MSHIFLSRVILQGKFPPTPPCEDKSGKEGHYNCGAQLHVLCAPYPHCALPWVLSALRNELWR